MSPRPARPPADLSAPPSRRSQVYKTPAKPLLASEVLAEEEAPREPSGRSCRYWLAGAAVVLAGVGLAMQLGLGDPNAGPQGAQLSFGAAGLILLLALLPLPYAARALASVCVGLGIMVLGLEGRGPLGGLTIDGGFGRDTARLVTSTLLPAALLLRGRYQSYKPSRTLLAGAVAASLPFMVVEIALAGSSSTPTLSRLMAAAELAVVSASLLAFASAPAFWAPSQLPWWVLGSLSAELALREFTPLAGTDEGSYTYLLTGIAVFATAWFTSAGVFQTLAILVSPRARAHLERRKRKPTPAG